MAKVQSAGDMSVKPHPLLSDFILGGLKLEKLGFIFNNDKVIVPESKAYE